MSLRAAIIVWVLGLVAGFFTGMAVFDDAEPIDMDKVLSTSGEWVDLMPAGWHFISCAECGYTYRFFYNVPGSWRATLSHDPLATEIMRDMLELEKQAPDEEQNNGPEEPDEEEMEL